VTGCCAGFLATPRFSTHSLRIDPPAVKAGASFSFRRRGRLHPRKLKSRFPGTRVCAQRCFMTAQPRAAALHAPPWESPVALHDTQIWASKLLIRSRLSSLFRGRKYSNVSRFWRSSLWLLALHPTKPKPGFAGAPASSCQPNLPRPRADRKTIFDNLASS